VSCYKPVTLVRPVNDPLMIVQDALTAAEEAIADRADVLTALYHARDVLLPHIKRLVPVPPSYGVIHGDVIRANAIVGPDTAVSVIDFDLCGLGWRAYDIASYLFAIRGTRDEVSLRAAFLAGYTSIRALSQMEQGLLPLFEAIRAVFDIGIPASAINSWGRANIDAFLDGSLEQLNQCLNRLLIS
jgi:Ser/Thr protein kinase RdoA (MazF antagonist)